MNAYYIQLHWKHHMIRSLKDSRKGMIEVIFTSLQVNANVTSRQERIFVMLDSKKLPYRSYDLTKYKALKQVVEVYIYLIYYLGIWGV